MEGNAGYTSDAIEAINYCKEMNVDVVNVSWGSTASNQALKDAMEESGLLFIAAAGNLGVSTSSVPVYPASFDLPNIISVIATDNNGNLASFSSYGSDVDVAAPGLSVSEVDALYDAAIGPKEKCIFENSDHCNAMYTEDKEEYESSVLNFLETYLN